METTVLLAIVALAPPSQLPELILPKSARRSSYLNVNEVQSAICVETICYEKSSLKRQLRALPI
jgi:hypothetical protein